MNGLLVFAAAVFFLGAMLAFFSWLLHTDLTTALGLLAAGLLCRTLAALPVWNRAP